MEILMEVGVAIPVGIASRKVTGFTPVYVAMQGMFAGESFQLPVIQEVGKKNPTGNMRYNLQKFGRTLEGRKFVVKEVTATDIRVWCIESPEKPWTEEEIAAEIAHCEAK